MAVTIDGTNGITTPTGTGDVSVGDDLLFTGTGNRITGDFSNATVANRVAFQTSTANSATSVYAIPNGTSTSAQFVAANNSDPTNAGILQALATNASIQLRAGITGTGSYLPMTFYTGGSERVRIDTLGSVGIGTSSPTAVSGYTFLTVQNDTNGGVVQARSSAVDLRMQSESSIGNIGNISNHPLGFWTNAIERMRIDSSGNVGIGTSSPRGVLDVNATDPQTVYIADLTDGVTIGHNGADSSITFGSVTTGARGVLNFNRSMGRLSYSEGAVGSEITAFSIDSSGNVLIKQTAASTSQPGIWMYSSLDYGRINMVKGVASGTITTSSFVFYYDGNNIGSIGNTSTATSYNTSSDYRLKENVAPMQNALATVAQLNPVTWSWKSSGEPGQGFIAHELQSVVPDCVTGEKDAVDEEGNPIYQGVDTSFLVATLTAAIQELNAKVDAQAAEIAALKGQA